MAGNENYQGELTKLLKDPVYRNTAARIKSMVAKNELTATGEAVLSELNEALAEDPDRQRGQQFVENAREAAAKQKANAKIRHENWCLEAQTIRAKPGHAERTDWYVAGEISENCNCLQRSIYNVIHEKCPLR